jgi:tetratricopeptide (TPR) repeat protein
LLRQDRIEDAAEAEVRLAGIWLNRGDPDRALEHLERTRARIQDRGPSPAKAFVLQELARVHMMRDDMERAIAVGSESLRLAEELGLEATRARNLNTLGVARVMSGNREGLDDLEQAVEVGAAINSHEQVSAAANLAWVVAVLGDIRRAGELHERSRSLAERLGVTSFIRWQEAEHVFYCHWEGRWDEALATADEFIGDVDDGNPHYMETACRYIRGAINLARGNPELALADAERGVEVARGAKDPQSLNPALAFRIRAELAVGRRDAANEVANELVAAWSENDVVGPHELVDGAWAFRELGRGDELREAFGPVATQTAWHEAARRVVTGDLAGAADVYAEIGSVPDETYARLKAAGERVRARDRAGADRQLQLALPTLTRLRASAWLAEAEALLAASA